MKIFGVNSTENPNPKWSITIAYYIFKKSHGLSINKVESFPSISEFELFLKEKVFRLPELILLYICSQQL